MAVTTTAAAWQQSGPLADRAETILAVQRGAPVTIERYSSWAPPGFPNTPNSPNSPLGSSSSILFLPSLTLSLKFQNVSEKAINVFEFGLVSFDIFDEFVHSTTRRWKGVIGPGSSQEFREQV